MKCPFTFVHIAVFLAGILSCISFFQYSKEFPLSKYVFSAPILQPSKRSLNPVQPSESKVKENPTTDQPQSPKLRPEVEKFKKFAEKLLKAEADRQNEKLKEQEAKENLRKEKGPVSYKAYVSMSSTADNYYLGSLPLAAMAWIRLGVQPMVCLVGDPKEYESNLTRPSIEILKKLNTTITFLQGKITLKKATIAQHCRLYAANSQLPLQPEDVIIISDSDYIPIHKERHWADGVDLMLYNSQCCGYENHRGSHFPHLTVLTMGMTVATFREVLGTSKARYENATSIEGDLLNSFGKEGFEEAYNQARDLEQLHKHRMWYSDQILISYRINQWKRNKPGVSRTGEWSLVGARLDRMSWPRPEEVEKINVSTYGDMHLMRPAMKKWLDIRPVFKNLFSPEFYKMADDYGVKLLDYHSQDLGPNPQSFV